MPSPEQKRQPNRGCLNAQKSREGSSLKETLSRAEKPAKPRLCLCSKIQRGVQSKEGCLPSRKDSPTAAVSMLKNQERGPVQRRLSPEQKRHPNRGCLYVQKSREGSSPKKDVSRAEKTAQPRLSLCSKIKRGVQSNGDSLPSRNASPTAAVS